MMCLALKFYVSVTLSFVNEVTAHSSWPEGTLFLIDVDVPQRTRDGVVRLGTVEKSSEDLCLRL